MNPQLTISRPRKIVVPAAVALGWLPGQHVFSRKYDGQFSTVRVGPWTLIAEKVRAKSGAKLTASDLAELKLAKHSAPWFYAAHSVAVVDGEDCSWMGAGDRWDLLRRLMVNGPLPADDGAHVVLADSGPGGEFFEAVIAAGGEGVCAAPIDAPWGLIYAAKPMLEVQAVVMAINIAHGTVNIADTDSLVDLGRVVCRKFAVRIGSVLDVECMGRHSSGALREAKVVGVRVY